MDHKILVVDDEAMVRSVIQRMLEKEDYQVKTVNSGHEAITEFQKYQPDLILLDLHLEDMNGLAVMSELKKISPETLIILITAYADVETAVKAMKEGAYDFIQKPFMVEELVLIIRKAMETIQLKHEVKILRQIHLERNDISPFLGKSPIMKHVLKKIEEVAVTDSPVLLTGEIGTGKELIAQYIHHLSHRFSTSLVKIDCEKMATKDLEENIFEINANQQVISLKNEWYEKLRDGTLLISSIEKTNSNFQNKLVQYLENEKAPLIRKNKPLFRVIATSNTPLANQVQVGLFDNALYQFLKPGEIKIPALRKHSDDILPMAQYYMERANHHFEKNMKGFTPEAQHFLITMPFKENVRELRKLIDRLVFLLDSDYITVNDLIQTGLCESNYCFQLQVHLNNEGKKEKIIPKLVRKIITKTLELTNGDLKQTAGLLGLHESRLNTFLTNQTNKN